MIIRRTIYDNITKRLANTGDHKIIIIYGARQVGKTTLVKEILSETKLNSEYFNCDYLDVQSLFSYENAANFENTINKYELIVLDEAQRIKNIGLVLKILHDEFPKLKVIATGSSSFDLSNMINEPLTGRKIIYQLYPFSFKELVPDQSLLKTKRMLKRVLRFGSYPSVILSGDDLAQENLEEIVSSYLFKDILGFQYLKKPELLMNLLKMLSFQISNEVSYTELSRKLQVDQTVIQRYIQLLEDSFIIFRLQALKRNLRNEVGKSRKVYFWDLGVRNALIQNTNSLDYRNDQGMLWENFCIAERMKFLKNRQTYFFNSYFWRTYNQKEIDYVEEKNGVFNAYEFKWSPKKKPQLPKDFREAYNDSSFSTITPVNFQKELLSI